MSVRSSNVMSFCKRPGCGRMLTANASQRDPKQLCGVCVHELYYEHVEKQMLKYDAMAPDWDLRSQLPRGGAP